ncbi:MAG: DEAD/DEAH box helicase family protein, partial [Mycobacteriales bacterium]
MLGEAIRDVDAALRRDRLRASDRATFQAVTLLLREERTRVQAGGSAAQQKRIDELATLLARTAPRDGSLLSLLAEDAPLVDGTRDRIAQLQRLAGVDAPVAAVVTEAQDSSATPLPRQAVPQSVRARQLANPFLEPDYESVAARPARAQLLGSWELLQPLLRAFENASPGVSSSMRLPEADSLWAPGGRELMPHQAEVIEAAADGHRTFLLADEPGLGKTAQALLAAEAAHAYPLLVVVPNVVKINWAREAGIWTPKRTTTVV